MDLGLSGKKGIVCAASKGLGRAVAIALARKASISLSMHEAKMRSGQSLKASA
jgi:hypothetical protein